MHQYCELNCTIGLDLLPSLLIYADYLTSFPSSSLSFCTCDKNCGGVWKQYACIISRWKRTSKHGISRLL